MRILIPVILLLVLASATVFYFLPPESDSREQYTTTARSPEQQSGAHYRPNESMLTPAFTEISPTWFQGADSIWGATGRDDRGHIWLGVSGSGQTPAHLYEYAPNKAHLPIMAIPYPR